MGSFHRIWVPVLIFIFSTAAAGQDPLDLIRRVTENYQNLRSFEFAGHLTTTIPGTEFQTQVETADAEAGSSYVPEHSPILKYAESWSFRGVKITDAHGKNTRPNFPGGGMAMPTHWGYYAQIAAGMTNVKELPSQTLDVDGAPVECTVLEVVYDRERWTPEERTVKYWIDTNLTPLVRKSMAQYPQPKEDRHDAVS